MQPNQPLDEDVVNLAKSIRQVESQGNPYLHGQSGEYGAYQFMPDTWASSSQKYLGQAIPLEQSTLQQQNEVAYKQLKEWKDQGYNVGQVASMWNAGQGRPDAYLQGFKGVNAQGVAYDTPTYASKVADEYQKLKQQRLMATGNQSAVPQDSLKGDIQARVQQFKEGQEKVRTGEISPARGLLRGAGAIAGGVADTLGRAASALTPDAIEEPIMNAIGGVVQQGMETPAGKTAVTGWQSFAEKQPELAQDIRDVGNIVGVIPVGIGGGFAAKTAKNAVKRTMIEAGLTPTAYVQRSIEKDLSNLLSRNQTMKRAVAEAKKYNNLDVFNLLKERHLFEGLKIENDKIDTKLSQEAIQERIDMLMDAKGQMLPELDKIAPRLTREQVRAEAYQNLDNVPLPPADKARIKARIDTQVDALPDEMDISMVDSHRAAFRNAARDARDRQEPGSEYTALENATRDLVFKATDNTNIGMAGDFAALNKNIKDLIGLKEFLAKRIDGQVVKGGRLGGYFANVVGGIAGSGHGMLGTFVGARIADSIAAVIRNTQLGNAIKLKLIKGMTNDPAAIEEAQRLLKQIQEYQVPMLPPGRPKETPPLYVSPAGQVGEGLQEVMDAAPAQQGLIKPPSGRPKVDPELDPRAFPEAYTPDAELPVIPMGTKSRNRTDLPTIQPGAPMSYLPEPKKSSARSSLLPPPKAGQTLAPKAKSGSSAKDTKKKGLIERTGEFLMGPANQRQRGFVMNPLAATKDAFEGFKDVTTKVLDELKGKSTISKQFLLDSANRPDLKQAERDLIRTVANEFPTTVPVREFANRVKTELLPLKPSTPTTQRYEGVSLPSELRGPVANYSERVYESPIKTSAGDVHFQSGKNIWGEKEGHGGYFAHTRIEDLPTGGPNMPSWEEGKIPMVPTRRIIEIQSDLFQKGRLEGEVPDIRNTRGTASDKAGVARREAELAKLEPYRNTWWERIVREEVKQAAKDGKTKLQFPTGETAMKIEGLGEQARSMRWLRMPESGIRSGDDAITVSSMKVGDEIYRAGVSGDNWIITDVLGDGKFKAVQKRDWEKYGNPKNLKTAHEKAQRVSNLNAASETFDISGKVDTNNPIYRFYEKDVQKYLTNKYGGKVITDPQGVKWVEIDVPKDAKTRAVEAFGAGLVPLIPMGMTQQENQR
jgi:hypothetical protein